MYTASAEEVIEEKQPKTTTATTYKETNVVEETTTAPPPTTTTSLIGNCLDSGCRLCVDEFESGSFWSRLGTWWVDDWESPGTTIDIVNDNTTGAASSARSLNVTYTLGTTGWWGGQVTLLISGGGIDLTGYNLQFWIKGDGHNVYVAFTASDQAAGNHYINIGTTLPFR